MNQIIERLDITQKDIAYLDEQLMENGRLKLLPAEFYHQLPHQHLRAWAAVHARYGFPTVELVGALLERIHGRSALEIGAGCGDLGFHLGIPMTDSYQQVTNMETVMMMAAMGQQPTQPPPDVSREDAETAVITRQPQVVIGSWITQKYKDGDDYGNMFGPDEDVILDNCETYIHIGNTLIHGHKRILGRPHEVWKYDWIVSRSAQPKHNCIYIWDRR